jgi:hypothetical protein
MIQSRRGWVEPAPLEWSQHSQLSVSQAHCSHLPSFGDHASLTPERPALPFSYWTKVQYQYFPLIDRVSSVRLYGAFFNVSDQRAELRGVE